MMDNKKFKQLFNDVARLYDFEQAYGAGSWRVRSVSLFWSFRSPILEIIMNSI